MIKQSSLFCDSMDASLRFVGRLFQTLSLVLVSSLILEIGSSFAQLEPSSSSHSDELQVFLKQLEVFESQFKGLSVTVEQWLTGNKDKWDDVNANFKVNSRWIIGTDSHSPCFSLYVEDLLNKGQSETLLSDGGGLFRVSSGVGGPVNSVSFEKNSKFRLLSDEPHVGLLLGFSLNDDESFSSLMQEKTVKLELSNEIRNGVEFTVLIGTSEKNGIYRFLFKSSPKMHLVRIEVEKLSRHLVKDFGCKLRPLSSPMIPDPTFLESIPEKDRASFVENLKKAPQQISRHVVYEFNGFAQSQDRYLPSEVKYESVSKSKGQPDFFLGRMYRVRETQPFEPKDSAKGWFCHLSVANETPAYVSGSEGPGWVYRDGEVVRILDTEAIGRIEGVRFRKPKKSWLYVVGVGLSLVFCSFLLYRQCRKK